MVLPTGTISLSQVNAELGISPTSSTISMDNPRVRCLASGLPARFPAAQFLTPGTVIAMSDLQGKPSATATGGNTVVDRNGFRVHTFTGPGTFTITGTQFLNGNYLVVAGGGTGGFTQYTGPTINFGGGGGAGGARTGTFGASPGSYSITVGGAGGNSSFSTLASCTGGGAGGTLGPGSPGGSGGGGSGNNGGFQPGGTGGSGEGNSGGAGFGGNAGVWDSGGGGGAGGSGTSGLPSGGGAGIAVNVAGVPEVYSQGGSGRGGTSPTIGGGGGSGPSFGGSGSAGKPGVVIIWYPLC